MKLNMAQQNALLTEGTGVSGDLLRGVIALFNDGRGVQQNISTLGKSEAHPILPDADYIVSEFTIVNTGPANAYIGYGNVSPTAGFLLPATASLTFEYRNPVRSRLQVCDGGTATTLQVIG